MKRGQTATETMIIMAVGMLFLAGIIAFSTNQLQYVSDFKRISQARASVNDLARTANEVYSEGVGSRKEVFITIPSSIDDSWTFVGKPAGAPPTTQSKTLSIGVLIDGKANPVTATTNYDVRGTMPTEPGGKWVVVMAREDYVQIESYNLVVSPISVSASMRPTNSTTRNFTVINEGGSSMNVELTLDWVNPLVSAQISENSFTLGSGNSKDIEVNFTASDLAVGSYTGSVEVNGTIPGQESETLSVSLLAIVPTVSEQKISLYPSNFFMNIDGGTSSSKEYTLCNDFNSSKSVDLTILGDAWLSFSGVGSDTSETKTVGAGSCIIFPVYVSVPGGTPVQSKVGYIEATESVSAYSDESDFTVNVTSSGSLDSTPPTITIDSPLNSTYDRTWVWGNVTLNEDGDWCGYSLNGAGNVSMSNDTSTHFYNNVSGLAEQPHDLLVYCNDSSGNMAAETVSFTVNLAAGDVTPPVIIIDSPSNSTYTTDWVWGNVSLDEDGDWCGYSLNGAGNVSMSNDTSTHFYKNVSGLANQFHEFWVYCNDSNGNTGSKSVNFTVDVGGEVTENITVVSTTDQTCASGCSPADLNDRDGNYESLLDKGDVLPMAMSDLTGNSVTEVIVFVDTGEAESGIWFGSLELYLSDSSGENGGTIYCLEDYTPPEDPDTTMIVFNCSEHEQDGGLDTVAEVNSMYVHIDNEDWGWPDSFKVDYVVVQVTHD
jgi:hypothetical protein